MDQTSDRRDDAHHHVDRGTCEAELHVRLCARRLTTGHVQFGWRIERVDYTLTEGDSMSGTFGPFQLPHECANEVAAAVRTWMRTIHKQMIDYQPQDLDSGEGTQLTLRDFLTD